MAVMHAGPFSVNRRHQNGTGAAAWAVKFRKSIIQSHMITNCGVRALYKCAQNMLFTILLRKLEHYFVNALAKQEVELKLEQEVGGI